MEPVSDTNSRSDLDQIQDEYFHTPTLKEALFSSNRSDEQKFTEGKKFTATTTHTVSSTTRVKVGKLWSTTHSSQIYGGTMSIDGEKTKVVVKRILISGDEKAHMQAVEREPDLWLRLQHPNILPLEAIATLEKRPDFILLVSRFQEHGNLVRYVHNHPDCNREQLVHDVVSGLHYMHSEAVQPLVHGDIKANNVIVSPDERALLMDFGTATTVEKRLSNQTEPLMRSMTTECYRPPEEWEARMRIPMQFLRKTREMDIYSLGGLMYHTLSGARPWSECTGSPQLQELLRKKARPCYPGVGFKLEPHQRQIEPRMWALVLWCMEYEPEDRPTSKQVLKYMDNPQVYEKLNGPDGINYAELRTVLDNL